MIVRALTINNSNIISTPTTYLYYRALSIELALQRTKSPSMRLSLYSCNYPCTKSTLRFITLIKFKKNKQFYNSSNKNSRVRLYSYIAHVVHDGNFA